MTLNGQLGSGEREGYGDDGDDLPIKGRGDHLRRSQAQAAPGQGDEKGQHQASFHVRLPGYSPPPGASSRLRLCSAQLVWGADIDEDMDVVVDGIAAEVWRYYDPKNTGLMKKTAIQAFFKGTPLPDAHVERRRRKADSHEP